MSNTTDIKGNIIDLHNRVIFAGAITIQGNRILSIEPITEKVSNYILPGFIDAHIHIESSMIVPYEFAKIALTHGTVATISDPHEIANVLGVDGVHYMIDNARDAKLKFHFGAPSCVPATDFETAGAVINSDDVQQLIALDDIYFLSEMMNYPGVLFKDPEVMRKLDIAISSGKPIDGHAPGLVGAQAKQYIDAGITTDHECYTLAEAHGKIEHGMKIIIREGSAAKNYDALHPLIDTHPNMTMFCSDDKHPDDLLEGHINQLVTRSIRLGYEFFDVLTIACMNPVNHYNMDVGLLRVGDKADFIIVKDIQEFEVIETYINGESVSKDGETILESRTHACPNNFNIDKLSTDDFVVPSETNQVAVITAIDGQLITERSDEILPLIDGHLHSDPEQDILKICVINRYNKAPVAAGFIKNFGIKDGAIASTVAHDSHNIVVVGSSDKYICQATNLLIENQGGLSAVNSSSKRVIGLPVAGLMSDQACDIIGRDYSEIDAFAKSLGSTLTAPFMTLSFMALLVIPKIKLSDKGLFDAEKFEFITEL